MDFSRIILISYQYPTVFLAAILISLTVKYYHERRRIFQLGSKLPGPKGWPFIGNLLDFLNADYDILPKINEYQAKYGLCAIWLGHQLSVAIKSPEHAEIHCNSYKLIHRGEKLAIFYPVIGKGLLFSAGDEWKKAKKIMASAFPYLTLKSFGSIIQAEASVLVDRLKEEVGKPSFLMFPYVRDCTFDIICNGAFEWEMKAQKGEVEILQLIEEIKNLVIKRIFSPWQQPDFLYQFYKDGQDFYRTMDAVNRLLDDHLERRIKYLEEEQEIKKDGQNTTIFWRKLLENKDLTKEEIRQHVYTTIVTAYETTSSAICIVLIMLALHPDAQERTYNELISVVQDGIFDDGKLQKLEYFERVINETLRLFPTVPLNSRKCTEDVRFGEFLIPAGGDVHLNIFKLHRDPEQFQNPDEFNPDNFLPENVSKRHPYAFIPFSMGPRKCIGMKYAMMSMKIIVGMLLMKYKIECDYKTHEEIPFRAEITIKITDDCPIRLLKR